MVWINVVGLSWDPQSQVRSGLERWGLKVSLLRPIVMVPRMHHETHVHATVLCPDVYVRSIIDDVSVKKCLVL